METPCGRRLGQDRVFRRWRIGGEQLLSERGPCPELARLNRSRSSRNGKGNAERRRGVVSRAAPEALFPEKVRLVPVLLDPGGTQAGKAMIVDG